LNNRIRQEKGSFYSKIFITITVSIVTTTLTLSSILYFNFESIVLQQIYREVKNGLDQTSKESELMTTTAATFARQIYNDGVIANLLNYRSPDITDTTIGIKQLDAYRATSPYIDSIYVYNSSNSTFYTSSDKGTNAIYYQQDFYDKGIVDIIGRFEDYPVLTPIPRSISVQYPSPVQTDCYTFLFYNTLGQADKIIVVNLSQDKLRLASGYTNRYQEDDTFVMDKAGMLVSASHKHPMLTNISEESFANRILSMTNTSGYFVDEVNGLKSLVTYSYPDSLNWRYVRVIPYERVVEQIQSMKMNTVTFGSAILIFGLLISYILSRRLSVNVDQKLARLQTLEADQRSSLHQLRQNFMRKLILDSSQYTHSTLEQRIQAYKLRLVPEAPYFLILFRIDHYATFTDDYHYQDRELMKFAFLNIACELLSSEGSTEGVDMGEDRIVLLWRPNPEGMNDWRSDLTGRLQKVRDSTLELLKLSVTAAVSTMPGTIKELSLQYDHVLDISLYRMFAGHGAILFENDYTTRKEKDYIYPLHKEKSLIDALMLGKFPELKEMLVDLLNEYVDGSFVSFHLLTSHLAIKLNNAIASLIKNHSLSTEFNMQSAFLQLNKAETLQEIEQLYFTMFDWLAEAIDGKKNAKQDDLVTRIKSYVEQCYSDQNLSVDSVADHLGMSATYIGRLFKKGSGGTILDHIVEVRMSRARELLRTTDHSIGEIAETVGFNNATYFYRVFKKNFGMTPNEFRKIIEDTQ